MVEGKTEELKFIVLPEDAGQRIDKYIAIKLGEEYSRTFVKTLIDGKLVQVNGEDIRPRYLISEGEEICLQIPPQKELNIEAQDIPLTIIYEDDRIMVVDKPAGLIVHPGSGNRDGTMVNALLHHCRELADTGNPVRPGIVHRLDKETTGLIVVAKDDKALRSLSRQFHSREVKKRYIALVAGCVESDNGLIDAPVARHSVNRKKMDINHENGKTARTVYHVAKRYKRFTVLKVEPETGRTHQIRVHMKYIGHPVLGDKLYGKGNEMARHALHAETLCLAHPDTGEYMEFRSPVPDDIIAVIKRGDF